MLHATTGILTPGLNFFIASRGMWILASQNPKLMDIRRSRREFKFLLPPEKSEEVYAEISQILPADQHGNAGSYPIVSEYFDTPERDAFWERDRKIGNRRKLRVRIYGSSRGSLPPSAFLEVKHKQDGVGVKRRMAVPIESVMHPSFEVSNLLDEIQPTLSRKVDLLLLEEIRLLLKMRGVLPAVQMRYNRVAFEGMGDDAIRITFDDAIRCRLERKPLYPDDSDFPIHLLPAGARLMEVKFFGTVPYWFRELTANHQLIRTPFSKYCSATERLAPHLVRHQSGQGMFA
ncbi:MAG: polyphosphate polymerase domain-containing protein [Luteolibacter sp.]